MSKRFNRTAVIETLEATENYIKGTGKRNEATLKAMRRGSFADLGRGPLRSMLAIHLNYGDTFSTRPEGRNGRMRVEGHPLAGKIALADGIVFSDKIPTEPEENVAYFQPLVPLKSPNIRTVSQLRPQQPPSLFLEVDAEAVEDRIFVVDAAARDKLRADGSIFDPRTIEPDV